MEQGGEMLHTRTAHQEHAGASSMAASVYFRAIPTLVGLGVLVGLVGFLFVRLTDVSVIAVAIGAALFVLFDYAIAPSVVEFLIRADPIQRDGSAYATDLPLGAIVVRQSAAAGVPLPRLAVVDDGNPNAFTFGHGRRDARLWVTRGLLAKLDDDELEAVIAHEVGHIRHRDVVIMTAASLIPMAIYLMARMMLDAAADDDADDDDGAGELFIAGLIGLLCWYISELLVLSLNRAREYAADHWSCESTGNGDALASALVKIAYGMSRERAAAKDRRYEPTKEERKAERRADAVQVLGILEPRAGGTLDLAADGGVTSERLAAALRWDTVNPWASWREKFSTHPLVARRIKALEDSGLPGKPCRFAVTPAGPEVSASQRARLWARFGEEFTVATLPWVLLAATVVAAATSTPLFWIGALAAVTGMAFFTKQRVRYADGTEEVPEVTALLERLDAGPVRGIPVEVRGRVIGRGTPGYALSPDLVLQDASGFVVLHYRNPIPFAGARFGLFRAREFLGEAVVARGWYHRSPLPTIELREAHRERGGRPARSLNWAIAHALAVAIFLAGTVMMTFGLVT
jgi:Zn-dependent protease with chaperone function